MLMRKSIVIVFVVYFLPATCDIVFVLCVLKMTVKHGRTVRVRSLRVQLPIRVKKWSSVTNFK